MKVKYVGDCGFYDGLTQDEAYEVIGDNGTQYVVNNDLGSISTISKDKFIVTDSSPIFNPIKEHHLRIHELKTVQPFFDFVWSGKKCFEVRKNDRDYRVGDLLLLKEYDPASDIYRIHEILVEVTFILNDVRYVKEDFVIMQFKELKRW